MGGVMSPLCWFFSLRHLRSGAFRLLGGARSQGKSGSLLEGPCQLTLDRVTFTSLPFPTVHHRGPLPLQGTPSLAAKSGPVCYQVTAVFPRSWCTQHLLRVEFLFPQVLWKSYGQIQMVFKAKLSEGYSSHSQTPRLRSPMQGSEVSLLWENFCGITIFQFVDCSPSVFEI